MKKKYVKRIIKILSILLIVSTVVLFCQNYFFGLNDHNTWRIRNFYLEEKDSLDVVFMGASDVYADISPALAYEEFGFTSYNYAAASSCVNLWKSQINEINRTQNPQYIVIEINGTIYEGDDDLFSNQGLRWYLDGVPYSLNKIETIANSKLEEDALSYYFPFIKYHGEIKDAKKFFRETMYYKNQGYAVLRGFCTQSQIDDRTETQEIDFNKTLPLNKNAEYYLIDFLEYCKKNNINNIIFTRFPHKIIREEMVDRAYRCNQAEKIIESYGYDYINLEKDYLSAGIDYKTDFYDDDHLNVFGARKLTHYWGDLLVNKYGIKGHTLTQEQQNSWEHSVEFTNNYIKLAEERINNGTEGAMSESKYMFDMVSNIAP